VICLLYYIMDAEGYRKLQPQYNELMSDVVNANINMLNILRTYGAAQDEALGKENHDEQIEYVNKLKQGNKVKKAYNLMETLTGNGPIAAYNDDLIRFMSAHLGIEQFGGICDGCKRRVKCLAVHDYNEHTRGTFITFLCYGCWAKEGTRGTA
jgi:hypothetical protein